MHKRKNLITLILPLWDREIYTSIWIKENVFDEFDYIIADGSNTNANQDIFNMLGNRSNIKYVRYSFDENIIDFVTKMLDAASQVETPYVMTCDNDDFLSYRGVIECINALESDGTYGFANGEIRTIKGLVENPDNPRQRYRLRSDKFTTKNLNSKTGIDAIKNLFRPYKHVWYGVYRSELYRNIWLQIAESKIDNVYLVELLHSQLAFCLGKLYNVNYTHYIRLENPVSNAANQLRHDINPHYYGIYFDEKYRTQVFKMAEIVANLLGVDKQEIYTEYLHYFTNKGSKKLLSIRLLDSFYNRILSFSLSLKTIRRIV